ncbi:hypothetical protein KGM_206307 [Danaus plexippus plexippus]|uniref:Uncharacterized protein n=1 Tax=Danaus plexippus plexippus TaxID=278856 RepID=A0A212EUB0_DANPL|nr:hypothetical protein KGM_206307 [Danaus plexippus plexippus]
MLRSSAVLNVQLSVDSCFACTCFEGREDVNDEERAGHPSTSTTDEKIDEEKKMVLANRQIIVIEMA